MDDLVLASLPRSSSSDGEDSLDSDHTAGFTESDSVSADPSRRFSRPRVLSEASSDLDMAQCPTPKGQDQPALQEMRAEVEVEAIVDRLEDKNEPFQPLNLALAVLEVLETSQLSYQDLYSIIMVFKGFANEKNITIATLTRFLKVFGPLEIAFQRSFDFLFESNGQVRRWFWGTTSKQAAENILLSARKQLEHGKYPLIFLVRIYHNRFVITYHKHDANRCKHMPIQNAGHLGYMAKRDGIATYFKNFSDILSCLPPGSYCIEATHPRWDQGAYDMPSPEEDVPQSPETELLSLRQERTSDEDDSSNPWKSFVAGLSPMDDMHNVRDSCEMLDNLLRQGAQNFRNGRRGEAASYFERVIKIADTLLVKRGSEPKNPHTERTGWCKCFRCAVFRAKGRALGNLGHVFSDKKEISTAVRLYEESLCILRELGMWKQEPNVLSSLTNCATAAGDSKLGDQYGIEYFGTLTQRADRKQLVERLASIGSLENDTPPSPSSVREEIRAGDEAYGKLGCMHAMPLYAQAVRSARELQDDLLEVNAMLRLGCCMFMMHRLRYAIVMFERSVLLLRSNNILVENRELGKARVELHNIALSFAKQASNIAGWNS